VQLCNNNFSVKVDDESECTELSDELIQRPYTQERYPKKSNYSSAIELHPKLKMHWIEQLHENVLTFMK